MNPTTGHQYLENAVTTATPQKLQLMLLDAALRFGTRAGQLWQLDKPAEATESVARCREIVAHLLGGLRRDQAPELVARVAAEYGFVLRTLVEASFQRDRKKLAAAIDVLAIQRDTWAQVCQELGETFVPVAAHPGSPLPALHVPATAHVDLPTSGFSLDA